MHKLTVDQATQLLKIAREIYGTIYKSRWSGDYSDYQDHLTDGWFYNITWRDHRACDVRESLKEFIRLGDQLDTYLKKMPSMVSATISYGYGILPENVKLHDVEMETTLNHSINRVLESLLISANKLNESITKLSFQGYKLKPMFPEFANTYTSIQFAIYNDQSIRIEELEERIEKLESGKNTQHDYKDECDILTRKNAELEKSNLDKTHRIDELQKCVGYLYSTIQSALMLLVKVPGSQVVGDILNSSIASVNDTVSFARSKLTMFKLAEKTTSISSGVDLTKASGYQQ